MVNTLFRHTLAVPISQQARLLELAIERFVRRRRDTAMYPCWGTGMA
jgi:hypothetical protein